MLKQCSLGHSSHIGLYSEPLLSAGISFWNPFWFVSSINAGIPVRARLQCHSDLSGGPTGSPHLLRRSQGYKQKCPEEVCLCSGGLLRCREVHWVDSGPLCAAEGLPDMARNHRCELEVTSGCLQEAPWGVGRHPRVVESADAHSVDKEGPLFFRSSICFIHVPFQSQADIRNCRTEQGRLKYMSTATKVVHTFSIQCNCSVYCVYICNILYIVFCILCIYVIVYIF